MVRDDRTTRVDAIAELMLSLLGTGRQITSLSASYPGFDLAQAYDVAARVRHMREARGEKAVGRKIGFTNTAVWDGYGISGPIWNHVYDTTVREVATNRASFDLGTLPEARIEPEIVLSLRTDLEPGMTDAEILASVDWVAHGFEIVYSIFPGWRFTAADAAAAHGVHAGLLIGERHRIDADPERWQRMLSNFGVELENRDGVRSIGHARNVLGSPLKALRFLVEEIARFPGAAALRAGEIITTGTLTDAMPARPGEAWTTRLSGIDLPGLELQFG